jgi:hypothetical protein
MNDAMSTVGRSRQARGLLLFTGLVGIVWASTYWILTGSFTMLIMGGMAIAMIIVVVNTLNDWRTGLFLFIVWLLLEDLARKFLGNSLILVFGKDVLAADTYLSWFLARRRRQEPSFRPPFLVPLACFFGLAVMQVFNTQSPSMIYGLLGLKLYFYYVPLMYAGYALLRTGRDLERFLIFNVGAGLLIAALGIIQSVVGLTFLNPDQLAPELETLGNLTRESPLTHKLIPAPTSVFVSSGRFAWYVILVAILAFGAQAYLLLTRRRRAAYGFFGIGVAVVAAMQSASRATALYTLISLMVLSAGFLWGAPWRWGQGRSLVTAIRRGFLVAAGGLLLMIQLFPASIGANWSFYFETLSPTSSASELQHRTWEYPLQNLENALQHAGWFYGYGTGTASLGLQYVARLLNQPPLVIGVENGFGVLMLEMGILAPLLWLIWTGSLLYYAWKVVRQLRETMYFPIALSIFWYSFLLLWMFTLMGMAPYQNYVMNAYFWLLIGVLFRLPHLAAKSPAMTSTAPASRLRTTAAYAGGF